MNDLGEDLRKLILKIYNSFLSADGRVSNSCFASGVLHSNSRHVIYVNTEQNVDSRAHKKSKLYWVMLDMEV